MRRGASGRHPAPGDYGKPRPAIVIQSDQIQTESVLVALLTGKIVDAPIYRLNIAPTESNGLEPQPSQVMVDKIAALPRAKCGPPIGRIEAAGMIALNAMLAVVLGLADPKRA